MGAALIVVLQSALIAGLVVQRARRRRTELALRESEQRFRVDAEQNQDLAGRLINAQEAERTRIARDLHDDLSQQLAGLAIMLSGLKRKIGKPDAQPEVDQTVATLQDRTQRSRSRSGICRTNCIPASCSTPAWSRRCAGTAPTSSSSITSR